VPRDVRHRQRLTRHGDPERTNYAPRRDGGRPVIVGSGLGSPDLGERLLIAAVATLLILTVVVLTQLRRRRAGRAGRTEDLGPVSTKAGDRPEPQV
jgi:hypothetical protein